ncbi:MAG: hypothetical protein ACOYT8_00735 [Candidatus Dependentiae bacterium]
MIFFTAILLLSCTAINLFGMEEQQEKQIVLSTTEDLLRHATRKNLGDPAVRFIIEEKLSSYFETNQIAAKESQLHIYNAVRKKIDPNFDDNIEKQLDELENLEK